MNPVFKVSDVFCNTVATLMEDKWPTDITQDMKSTKCEKQWQTAGETNMSLISDTTEGQPKAGLRQ